MKYSETGKFTDNQKRIAKRISSALSDAKKAGLVVLSKNNSLVAFIKKEYDKADLEGDVDRSYPLRYLDCGRVLDRGADDYEYFLTGVITED